MATGLSDLAGERLTFGGESSTSGRLMPEYFRTPAYHEYRRLSTPT